MSAPVLGRTRLLGEKPGAGGRRRSIVGHPATRCAGLRRGVRFTFSEWSRLRKRLRRASGLLAGVHEGLATARGASGMRPPVFHVLASRRPAGSTAEERQAEAEPRGSYRRRSSLGFALRCMITLPVLRLPCDVKRSAGRCQRAQSILASPTCCFEQPWSSLRRSAYGIARNLSRWR